MDDLVQIIENAAANVDGAVIEKVAVDKLTDSVGAEDCITKAEVANAADHFKGDAEILPVAGEIPAQEVNEQSSAGDNKTSNGVTEAEPLSASDAPETMEVDSTKPEDAIATSHETLPDPVPTTTTTTTTTEEEVPSSTTTESTAVEEVAAQVADEPVAVSGECPAPEEPPVVESTPTIEESVAAIVGESMDVTEKPEEVSQAVDAPPPEERRESVIDLDSTVEDLEDKPAPDDSVVEINDSVAEQPEPEPETSAPVEKIEPIAAAAVVDESGSEMEVTHDETVEETLETPKVSICPLGQPQLAEHNRISELVHSNGSSTPNTSNPTSVEFQATPIKKTIEDSLQDTEEKSSTDVYSIHEIDSKTSSSDDGGMKRLQETLKQVNGTTTPESSSAAEVEESKHLDITDSSVSLSSEDQVFETVLNFQNGMLHCLYVERVVRSPIVPQHSATEGSDAASEKSGSNGSATSLGPFALPNALTHTASGLSVSSQGSVTGEKGRVQGVNGLRNFLQEVLKKLPEEKKRVSGRPSKGRASAGAVAKEVPATPTRATAAAAPAPKAAEAAKKTVAFAASTESQVGNFVMARWADKKYYAGRVMAEKPGNKFQVRFEDGAQRTLPRDQLVFGDSNVAQVLLNHECNVLVEPNIYETGLVISIDAEACTYSVMTDSGSVTVPASDLYLDEEQAKACQNGGETKEGAVETAATGTGRRKRISSVSKSSPEAGPSSVGAPAAKKSRKRQPPPPQPQIQSCDSQLSDLSDTFESETRAPEISYVEAVDGVQPELFKCPMQAKIKVTCGYQDYQNGDLLGPLPTNSALFRNKSFILTAPEPVRNSPSEPSPFSELPFDMEHLCQQIRFGGGTIYEHFEEIPKAKYKSCVLITKEPCLTARYISGLAVNMVTVSHAWVIESCRQNKLMDLKAFALPAGWSMAEQNYVRYVTGRNERRANAHPFMNLHILVSSENEDFINFWTRVCKFGDAKVKTITSVLDITVIGKNRTYMLTDSELKVANVEKAKSLGIPVVSTAWISECLVQGKTVSPEQHANFTKANWDDIHH